ncbi:MAG: penicillin-binding protein 1C, partial [Prevotellaceae bacterium]|nr:penicillin-binding protein 1C [Prevotellaceae bacterium]
GELFSVPCSVVMVDDRGELLGARVAADGQWRFPPCDSVPYKVAQAMVAFEDKRFYRHIGIDFLAVGRALAHNIRSGRVVEGGSTITMQVIRLSRKNRRRTLLEKAVEAVLATRLELRCSKAEILALYASYAPFGGNVVGLDGAAWRYFGRSSQQLSWAEAATLAVLPNSPAIIHPARNRASLLAKRDALLEKLCAKKLLSEEMLALSKLEPLPDKPLALPALAPHLLGTLAAANPQESRLHVTLDIALQQAATQVLASFAAANHHNQIHNAAAIIAEVESGRVLAYVGNVASPSADEHGSHVDVAQASRSTGSILKPFLYAAMLSEGDILPRMLVTDYPFYTAGFAPSNFSKSFDGAVPACDALARSLNVPAVRMLKSYSVEKFHGLLRQLGMASLAKPADHYGLSLILGGAEISLHTAASMYAYLGRMLNHYPELSGRYSSLDLRGLTAMEPAAHRESQIANRESHIETTAPLNASAVWLTLDALTEVSRPEEDALWAEFASSHRVAWKTGTSYGHRDAWAVGLTPRYVVGVWVGNASGEGRPGLTGVSYAAPILFELFGLLPHAAAWFAPPYDDMAQVELCRQSGHRASPICTATDTAWIPTRGEASPQCPYHVMLNLDQSLRYRVNSRCYAVSQMQRRAWFVLPPAQEYYYRQRHHDYHPAPPLHPRCADDEGQAIELIYPMPNTGIAIPRQLDGSAGQSIFRAAHRSDGATIFWHIDGEYVGSTQGDHHLALHPAAGRHTLTLVDDEGGRVRVGFEVKE